MAAGGAAADHPGGISGVRLGLRANWRQFALLVAINAFVGGMVGLERSVLPLLAKDEFGIASKTLAVSFIATFGLAKAVTNLYAGSLSERFTRRRVLIAGWLFAVPVPFIIIFAPSWGWVVAANALLGVNQGLAWSMTVNMKIDLAGPRRRGLGWGSTKPQATCRLPPLPSSQGSSPNRKACAPSRSTWGSSLPPSGWV